MSISPQAWLVERIGGDHLEVITLVEPGESPATYQPTDAQVSRVMGAAAYFRIGVPFENGPWFRALQGSRQLLIVDTRRGIPLRRIEAHAHGGLEEGSSGPKGGGHVHEPALDADDHDHEGHHHAATGKDPHIWLSPRLLKIQARTVAETLESIDPARADTYRRNLAAVETELDETDRAIRDMLAPFAGRTFFVFHPAWGYFADEYGLRQVAVEVEGKQPSDHELTELQQQARAARVDVIFVQPQISGRSAEIVAEAVGAQVKTLDPLSNDVPAGLLRAAEALAGSFQ